MLTRSDIENPDASMMFPPGTRVARSGNPGHLGTVVEVWDPFHETPYIVKWDGVDKTDFASDLGLVSVAKAAEILRDRANRAAKNKARMNTRISTMALVPKILPTVLEVIQRGTAKGPPIPMKALLADTALMASINQVRLDEGMSETYRWPTAKHLLEKALQSLRRRGDIKASPLGWCVNGTIIEPAETLTDNEFKDLKATLDVEWTTPDAKLLVNKVLRAVRHRK